MIGVPEVVVSPWTPVFDQHVPARVLSAVSLPDGFSVLSGEDGVAIDTMSAIVARLREAGFAIAATAAPLPRLSVLNELIRDALVARGSPEQLLVVIIARAESLSAPTVRRLATLAALRQNDQPVMRFLLTGTPGLWTVLRGADLGGLENDAAAHVRLMPEAIQSPPVSLRAVLDFDQVMADQAHRRQAAQPQPSAVDGRPEALPLRLRDSRLGHRAALVIVGLTLAGIALAGGVATWAILVPRADRVAVSPTPPVAVPMSPDARLATLLDRENRELAADHPLPGDNLIETRRQIDELLPEVSGDALRRLAMRVDRVVPKAAGSVETAPAHAAPASDADSQPTRTAPISPRSAVPGPVDAPIGNPVHVTLHYSRGDAAAAARAMRIRTLLRARGVAVDATALPEGVIGQSSVAYYFTQDQGAALDLAQQLLPRTPQIRKLPPPDGAALPRPGEISISIGSSDANRSSASSRKQT